MLTILVVLPFVVSAVISALVHNERPHKYVALAAGIASFIIAVLLYMNPPGMQSISWFSIGNLQLSISTTAAPLHMLLLMLVASIAPLILLYSMGFIRLPSEQRGYYFAISIFTAAMMLFAIGADLITIFIGWELLGLTSYLLIGFWRHKDSAVSAARKAIITILIGDILVFAAILLIWSQIHTFDINSLIQTGASYPLVKVAIAMIIIGAFTKSAQFPFNEWLPDAMEGPTPVSAFLHSSTMVKAGVFLLAILLPLISQLGMNYILLLFGLASTIIGAVNALSETHMKRILAYSTIEDIGLMLIALGFNSIPAAMLLFFVQTFYKALLFMSAGSIMTANSGEENINESAGPLSKKSVLIPTIIGVASLAGIFPLSGFFGKIGVEAAATNTIVYAVLLLVELLSSLYIFRWLLVPLKLQKGKSMHEAGYGAVHKAMIAPMYILAAVAIAASVLIIYVPSSLGIQISLSNISYIEIALFLIAVLVGALLSYALYYKRIGLSNKARKSISSATYLSRYINSAYGVLASAVLAIGGAAARLDYYLYTIVKDGGIGIKGIGTLMKRMQNGSLNYYLLAFVIGAMFVMLLAFVI